MQLNIRKGLSTDLSPIAEYYGPTGDTPWDPFTSQERLRESIDLNDLIIAEVDGVFAGFVYFFVGKHPWFEPEVGLYGHILEVHVRKECADRGVATKLLDFAVEDMKRRGVGTIYIDCRNKNFKALHLYKKLGFEEFDRHLHLKKAVT